MAKRTPVQVPDEPAGRSAAVRDAGRGNLSGRVVGPLEAEIERVRGDDGFTARAVRLLERDREILDRLAE